MITLKDIAKQCNVSPGTVSNVLNGKPNVGEETRQRVLDCVRETGYKQNYFAQSMRNHGSGSKIISIITEGLGVFGTHQMVSAVMTYCDDNNYRTILMNLGLYSKFKDASWFNDREILVSAVNPAIQEARAIRVDGIIYIAGHCRVIDCFPPDFPIPVVIAYGLSKDERYPSIIIDDEAAGYNAAKYLIAKGHRRIGIIAGAVDNHHTISRLQGFQRAMYEGGILYNPSSVYYGDWKRQSGYQGAASVLGEGVTAIFCLNDDMAAGAYDYLYEHKIAVGRDISVMGFDNMELSGYLRPQLTTSEIQLHEIGRRAAETMLGALSNDCASLTCKIPCNIIERESVASI